jgi:uncharacterized protein YndB with AHSA1/START domain
MDTSNREIVISRVINAPIERVWDAFTNPEHLVHWWGPDGFTNTFKEIDVRVGGVWRFTMHGPDGTDYPNKIVYKEIVKHQRLVYDHSDDDGNPAQHFEDTVTFEDLGGSTKVTLRLLFATKEDRDKTAEFGAVEGGNQTLGRLAEYVKTM